jgi:hypothetical protein
MFDNVEFQNWFVQKMENRRVMTSLEQEIYEKFQQLDGKARQRMIARLQETVAAAFDWDDWIARVNTLQTEVRATQGHDYRVDVVGLLREIREDED